MQFIARAPIVPGLVFILLLCWAQDSFSQDIPLDEKLERASGLALVEISSLTDFDRYPPANPGGGYAPSWEKGWLVKFEILKSTGVTFEEQFFVTGIVYAGNFKGKKDETFHKAAIDSASLKVGDRYWVAFVASADTLNNDNGVNPYNVLLAKPESDKDASGLFEDAIEKDKFKWRPHHFGKRGLSAGHLVTAKDQWKIRVWKEGKLVWEKSIPGSPGCFDSKLDERYFWRYEQGPSSFPRTKSQLFAATTSNVRLDDENEYGLPKGTYCLKNYFDAYSGAIKKVEISLKRGDRVRDVREYWYSENGKLWKTVIYHRQ